VLSALTLQKLIVYRPAFSCRLPNEAVLRKVRPSCPVLLTDFHPKCRISKEWGHSKIQNPFPKAIRGKESPYPAERDIFPGSNEVELMVIRRCKAGTDPFPIAWTAGIFLR